MLITIRILKVLLSPFHSTFTPLTPFTIPYPPLYSTLFYILYNLSSIQINSNNKFRPTQYSCSLFPSTLFSFSASNIIGTGVPQLRFLTVSLSLSNFLPLLLFSSSFAFLFLPYPPSFFLLSPSVHVSLLSRTLALLSHYHSAMHYFQSAPLLNAQPLRKKIFLAISSFIFLH